MRTHVRILAIVNIVVGSIGLFRFVSFLLYVVGLGTIADGEGGAGAELFLALLLLTSGGGIASVMLVLIAGLSLLALPTQIIGGIGLLKGYGWARILVITTSALGLLSVSIGTVIGLYGLWVLLNEETIRLFRTPAPLS